MFFKPTTPIVPRTFPPISFLKLQDYIKSLSYVAYWPLDDAANNPFLRVFNPAVAKGRQLALTPDFATDTNWTKGTGWTIASGVAVATAAPAASLLSQANILTVGRAYEITFDVTISAGTMCSGAGTTTNGATRSVSGTYTDVGIASTSTFLFRALTTFTGTVDNVSVKELNIPANDAVPIQVADATPWTSGALGSWSAGNSANVTFPTVTLPDGSTGFSMKISRNGVNSPYVELLNVTVIGQAYRVFLCERGTSTTNFLDGVTSRQSMGSSADWIPYDFTYVAASTSIRINPTTVAGTQYGEVSLVIIALDTGIRQGNVLVNSTTFPTDISSWTAANAAVVTWESDGAGGHCIRNTRAGTNGAEARQLFAFPTGKRIWVTGEYRTNGASGLTANISVSSNAVTIFAGSNPVIWTAFSGQLFTGGNGISLRVAGGASGDYAEWRNVVASEISPLSATPVNGVVTGNSESPLRLGTSVFFDSINDYINAYSTSLNSIIPVGSKTFNIFANISLAALTDGAGHTACRVQIDTNNSITIQKTTANNTFTMTFSTSNGINIRTITISAVGWHLFSITYDSVTGIAIFYLDGVQQGASVSGCTDWVGNLAVGSVLFGGITTVPATPWSGYEAHIWIENIAELPERLLEAAKLGDAA